METIAEKKIYKEIKDLKKQTNTLKKIVLLFLQKEKKSTKNIKSKFRDKKNLKLLEQEKWEKKDTDEAIKIFKKEKKAGKLFKINSFAELC